MIVPFVSILLCCALETNYEIVLKNYKIGKTQDGEQLGLFPDRGSRYVDQATYKPWEIGIVLSGPPMPYIICN